MSEELSIKYIENPAWVDVVAKRGKSKGKLTEMMVIAKIDGLPAEVLKSFLIVNRSGQVILNRHKRMDPELKAQRKAERKVKFDERKAIKEKLNIEKKELKTKMFEAKKKAKETLSEVDVETYKALQLEYDEKYFFKKKVR